MQNGRHTVGERDLLLSIQPDQAVGLVAAGVHLLDAHQGGDIGHTPGMYVKHRCDRHVDIIGAQQRQPLVDAQSAHGIQGVQDQLAVGEIHAFRVAGSARGVEKGRHRVFIEIGKVVLVCGPGQQVFIFPQHRQRRGSGCVVRKLQVTFDGVELPVNLFNQRQEIVMHEHQVVLGMVHGEEHLIRRKTDVHGMQHRADHRHGKETFQVAMAIPVKQGHRVPGLDAGSGQGVGQLAYPLVERLVAVAQLVGIHDFPARLVAHAGQQQLLDQQGIGVGAVGGRNYFCRHHGWGPGSFNQKCAASSS
ncbi:hypothetical protein D3C84_679280 [compost metagenome]